MIRFYINGTAGSKDGTEVTADNPIVADGMFPSGSTPATKTVSVSIRADVGESYTGVLIGTTVEQSLKISNVYMTKNVINLEGSSNYSGIRFLKNVTDINQQLIIEFTSTSDETGTIDTSLILYALPLNWQV
nr:MAG TPA: hypothetical protein [Caudoviricetes sp.]